MTDNPIELVSPVWTHLSDVVVERAEGVHVYTSNGQRYLDFTSGIGVTNTGHCHPKVVAAAQAQIGKVIHAQINVYHHQPIFDLVSALKSVAPAELDTFFFSNSGAEAVEASIKLARQTTGKPNIIVFQGSFHGRTVAAMSLTTSKTIYRLRYQPLMAGTFVAPYPYAYYYGWEPEQTSQWCLKQLRHLLVTQTDPSETAAILVEPVLGEGGYVPPPPSFLPGVRQICDEHDILFIADEVQSGFGRTGRFFAVEHFDVTPDIMVMAKGLGSGFPISGIAARRELMARWVPGSHDGTYGGNAVCCAAAAATVQAICEEGLVENAARMGTRLMDGLRGLQAQHPIIGDVRGLGLMVATEFASAEGEPDKPTAKAVQQCCLEAGLFLLTCGAYDNTIRWIPPLVVNAEQIDQSLEIFGRALES